VACGPGDGGICRGGTDSEFHSGDGAPFLFSPAAVAFFSLSSPFRQERTPVGYRNFDRAHECPLASPKTKMHACWVMGLMEPARNARQVSNSWCIH
jgi:hypothetical protein